LLVFRQTGPPVTKFIGVFDIPSHAPNITSKEYLINHLGMTGAYWSLIYPCKYWNETPQLQGYLIAFFKPSIRDPKVLNQLQNATGQKPRPLDPFNPFCNSD
jgi:hypothetical protein